MKRHGHRRDEGRERGSAKRPRRERAIPASGRAAWLAAGLAAGALLGSVATALADEQLRAAVAPDEVSSVREWPRRVVPVEWRWTPRSVDVDRMFRKRR